MIVAAGSAVVSSHTPVSEKSSSPASPPAVEEVVTFPASFDQARRLGVVEQAGPTAADNVAVRWRFVGSVSDAALKQALNTLVQRYEILRTVLVRQGTEVLQQVRPRVEVPLHTIDLSALEATARAVELERIGRAEALLPLDPREAPLVRAVLVRLDPKDAVLHLNAHQVVVDHWSIGYLVEELAKLVSSFDDACKPAQLPDVELHFGDYARWQQAVLESGGYAEDLQFWQENLNGMVPFEVPADELGEEPAASEIQSILLPSVLTSMLESRAQAEGQTLFSLALASLAGMLARATGRPTITLGTQVAGRSSVAAEQIVGPLINTLLLRLELGADPSLQTVLERVQATFEEALAHEELPFPVLEQSMATEAGEGVSLLPSVNFTFQKIYLYADQTADHDYGRFRLEALPSFPTSTHWDLNFFMVGRAEGWRISCEANPAKYRSHTVRALLELWRCALLALAGSDSVAVSGLPFSGCGRAEQREPAVSGLRLVKAKMPQSNPRLAALQERIVAFNEGGSKTPVCVLNNTAVLYPLSLALGEDRPLYDIQICPSEDPIDLPERDFRDLARDALEMVRLARPRGPYILSGLCVCGALAFEVANQLRSEGEEVELVIANDTWAPGYREEMSRVDKQLRAWQVRAHSVRRDAELAMRGQKSVTAFLTSYRILRNTGVVSVGARLGLLESNPVDNLMRDENRWFTGYLGRALRRYKPLPYDGPLLVLRSQQSMTGRLFAWDMGWSRIATGRLQVVRSPGMHDEMFRPAGCEVFAKAMHEMLGEPVDAS